MIASLKYNRNLRKGYQDRYARTKKVYSKNAPSRNRSGIAKNFNPDQVKLREVQKRVRRAQITEALAFVFMGILILVLVLWILIPKAFTFS